MILIPQKRIASFRGLARSAKSSPAFTLSEVVIALSIVSFALIPILGLMPIGLSTMREAMDQTAKAQIVQRISTEASLTPFSKLDAYVATSPFYFDQDGQLQLQKGDNTCFAVTVSPLSADYPGSAAAVNLSSSVAAFKVDITRSAGTATFVKSTSVIYIPNSGN